MNIKEKIQFYVDSLNCFEDTMEKYKFLLDQGKKSKPFPEEFRQNDFKVKGWRCWNWAI